MPLGYWYGLKILTEMSFRGDLWQKDSTTSERGGLKNGSEICCDVWFQNCGTEKKTEVRAEIGRVKDW